MSSWDIDPAGVRGVVNRTVEEAKKFEGEAKTYATAIENAAASCGSGIVAKALADFAAHHKDAFKFLVERSSKVITAGVEATQAYIQGDLEMAARAQRNAASTTQRPK